jgi:hypothetical protein
MNDNSNGVTATERLLAAFCERSLLKLWSYPNPYKEDGHELCDLLAVFENRVFIFFDRESALPELTENNWQVPWDRWKRNVIDRQIKTAHGAERYIKKGRPIFLDPRQEKPFPIGFNPKTAVFHKIIVAHGAEKACLGMSAQNVSGSLGISYTEPGKSIARPFHVEIDRKNVVHIFDSHNIPILLQELDTVRDLSAYLDEKVRAATKFDHLSYCGEEDLLAHYFQNYDRRLKRNVIGPTKERDVNGFMIAEGEWCDFRRARYTKTPKPKTRFRIIGTN